MRQRLGRRLRHTALGLVLGVAVVATLVLALDPRAFAEAVRHFDVTLILPIALLSLGYYLLQGVRWYFLLRTLGVPINLLRTVQLNVAGQSAGLLPAGELTRAVFVSETTGAQIGGVVASITVQELIYTLILIAAAVPGSLRYRTASSGVIAALLGTIAVFVILLVPSVFHAVLALVRRIPLLRSALHDIERLQHDTVTLLRHRDTAIWSVLSVLGALGSITLFWLVCHSVAPGQVTWPEAAFVYTVSHVVGAISFVPGGVGAYEASTVGLLHVVGLDVGTAAAVAVLHRLADKGLGTLYGLVAYLMARRHLRFGAIARTVEEPGA